MKQSVVVWLLRRVLSLLPGMLLVLPLHAEPDASPQPVPLRLQALATLTEAADGALFSVVIPRRLATPTTTLAVRDGSGKLLPTRQSVRLRWPTRQGDERAVRVIDVLLAGDPALLANASLTLTPGVGPLLAQPVPEQPARMLALLPPRWQIDAMLFGRAAPIGASPHWFDAAMLAYTRTATDQVPDSVLPEHRVPWDFYWTWLFDRPGIVFQLWFRSADPAHLHAADTLSQRYIDLLLEDGRFGLRPKDMKYSYSRPLLYRWMLFGETGHATMIRRIAEQAEKRWPVTDEHVGFWTERHTTYAIASAVHAWELDGEVRHLQRIQALLAGLDRMSQRPDKQGKPMNCPVHTMAAHEGTNTSEPVCSPWFTAILAQIIEYYYRLSDDPMAATLLARLHRFLIEDALYVVPHEAAEKRLRGMTLPWYLASRDFTFTDNGPYGDIEHACDVLGAVLRTGAVRAEREPLPARHGDVVQALLTSCRYNMDMWHRPHVLAMGIPEWQIKPPRKYNWWFGSTQPMSWWLEGQ